MKLFLLNRIKKKIIIGINKKSGINSFGRKTIFTQSGGYRQFLYLMDYKRIQTSIYTLLTIEKNNKFTAFIGLIYFANGFFNYIIISDFMNKIDDYYYGFTFLLTRAPTSLYNIPAGNFIHHIEMKPTKGAKLMRAAGTTAFIISQDDKNSFLKMKSG
jgi:large subunit ribosomal protein L2